MSAWTFHYQTEQPLLLALSLHCANSAVLLLSRNGGSVRGLTGNESSMSLLAGSLIAVLSPMCIHLHDCNRCILLGLLCHGEWCRLTLAMQPWFLEQRLW